MLKVEVWEIGEENGTVERWVNRVSHELEVKIFSNWNTSVDGLVLLLMKVMAMIGGVYIRLEYMEAGYDASITFRSPSQYDFISPNTETSKQQQRARSCLVGLQPPLVKNAGNGQIIESTVAST